MHVCIAYYKVGHFPPLIYYKLLIRFVSLLFPLIRPCTVIHCMLYHDKKGCCIIILKFCISHNTNVCKYNYYRRSGFNEVSSALGVDLEKFLYTLKATDTRFEQLPTGLCLIAIYTFCI